MATKNTIKTASAIMERFFREAEGKTNRRLDILFILEDMDLAKEKAEEALEFLVSRGLLNTFGSEYAFLTDRGVKAVAEELDLSKLEREQKEFGKQAAAPAKSAPAKEPSAQTTPPRAAGKEEAPAPRTSTNRPLKPLFVWTDADGKEHVHELGLSAVIGRAPTNEVHLSDQRASKQHAEVTYRNGTYVLRDLGAANGTIVNGEFVEETILKHDDEILIGRSLLYFRSPKSIPVPAQAAVDEDTDSALAKEEVRVVAGSLEERPPAENRSLFADLSDTPQTKEPEPDLFAGDAPSDDGTGLGEDLLLADTHVPSLRHATIPNPENLVAALDPFPDPLATSEDTAPPRFQSSSGYADTDLSERTLADIPAPSVMEGPTTARDSTASGLGTRALGPRRDTEGADEATILSAGLRTRSEAPASVNEGAWGEELANGGAQSPATARLPGAEPGEALPEAHPDMAAIENLPLALAYLRAVHIGLAESSHPDRARLLAAVELLESHPYIHSIARAIDRQGEV